MEKIKDTALKHLHSDITFGIEEHLTNKLLLDISRRDLGAKTWSLTLVVHYNT